MKRLDNKIALRQCESIYDEGISSIFKVSRALQLIKKMELYSKDYGSFETYCEDKLKINSKDANNIIDFIQVSN